MSTSIASQLVGVWQLVSYTDLQIGRDDTFPFGPEPEGFLIYTADGFFSAQLMRPGRARFQSNQWHVGTTDEYHEAGRGYIAYCGVYQVDEGKETVTHTPSVALVPNLISKGQLRTIKLHHDRLTLCTAAIPIGNGTSVASRLEWQKVNANARRNEERALKTRASKL